MNAFSTTELGRMQATQVSAMMDTCKILAYSSSADRYGNPTPSYAAGSDLACGFNANVSDEVQESGEVVTIDATIRLPLATVLDSRDRLRITKRFGVAVAAVDYEIVGSPARGPSGLVVKVRKVTV